MRSKQAPSIIGRMQVTQRVRVKVRVTTNIAAQGLCFPQAALLELVRKGHLGDLPKASQVTWSRRCEAGTCICRTLSLTFDS